MRRTSSVNTNNRYSTIRPDNEKVALAFAKRNYDFRVMNLIYPFPISTKSQTGIPLASPVSGMFKPKLNLFRAFSMTNYFTTLLVIVMTASQLVLADGKEGPSHGGGGDERTSTNEEIGQALNEVYRRGSPDYYLSTISGVLINPENFPSNKDLNNAYKKVLVNSQQMTFGLAETAISLHNDVQIMLRNTCVHMGKEHLATNHPIANSSSTSPKWEICYNLKLLKKYSPASLVQILVPLHFHELTEISGFSHEMALKIQEVVRYRITLAPLLSALQIVAVTTNTSLIRPDLAPAEMQRTIYTLQSRERFSSAWTTFTANTVVPLRDRELPASFASVDTLEILSILKSLARQPGPPLFERFCENHKGTGNYDLSNPSVLSELTQDVSIDDIERALVQVPLLLDGNSPTVEIRTGHCHFSGLPEQNKLTPLSEVRTLSEILEKTLLNWLKKTESKIK